MAPTARMRILSGLVLGTLILAGLGGPHLAAAQGQEEEPESDVIVPPERGSVWTVFTTVEAEVVENYAVVNVIADIGNRGPDPEFPFQVRVPADAFVTGLTITRDGETHEAEVKPREQARQEYDEHKAKEMTGGLVERTRGTQLYAFLVNVAEFESVRAVLTYEVYLAADEGVFSLPLEAPVSGFGEDLGAAFEVTVQHPDGVRDAWAEPAGRAVEREDRAWSLTHRVGPRPDDAPTLLNASYTLEATPGAGTLVSALWEGQGYFAHRFRAPSEARQLPLDLVLVLDTSGSMSGLKMAQMQDAASQVIGLLDGDDRLHLVLFSSAAGSSWPGLRDATPEQRRQAVDEVRAAFAAGGTNIEDGISRGFAAFEGVDWAAEEGRFPALVFLTDGQPSTGETRHDALRAAAREANEHGAHVFALAFGRDADWGLVAGLAQDGQGVALRVPEGQGAEVDLRQFMGALTTPVLRDVAIAYDEEDGGVTAHRRSAPVLFAGSELLVVGTFNASQERIRGMVSGFAPDGPRNYTFDHAVMEDGDGRLLARIFAYEQIRALEERIAADGARPEWVESITGLALQHGFVTDYTSLVVTLAAREWQGCTPERPCTMAAQDGRADASAPPPSSPSSGATPTKSSPSSAPSGSGGGRADADAWDTTASSSNAVTTGASGSGALAPEELAYGDGSATEADGTRQDGLRDRTAPDGAAGAPGFGAVAALGAVLLVGLALRGRRRGGA